MPESLPGSAIAALMAAQGLSVTPESAEAYARFAALQLGNSAKSFAQLAFEEEPAGYTAALKAHAK